MNSSTLWLLSLLGVALFAQGVLSMPAETAEDDYLDDEEGGGADEDEEDFGPPPKMISKPMRLTLRAGVTAMLPCMVEGNPDGYSRVWRKNEKETLFTGSIIQTNNQRMTNHENGTLEIRAIEPHDEGEYLCMISSSPPLEVMHKLTIQKDSGNIIDGGRAIIKKILPNDKLIETKKSKSLELECIAFGNPDPTIYWFKDGHMLDTKDPIKKGLYKIEKVTAQDEGVYECRAENGHDSLDSRKVEVKLLSAPEIQIERDIVPTGEGYESELRCIVSGYRKPEVQWYKGDRRLVNTDNIKVETNKDNHILKVLKTKVEDFGEYTCQARNTEGENKAIMNLTGKPAKPIMVPKKTDDSTQDAVITFDTESYSPILEYYLEFKDINKDNEWIVAKPQPRVEPAPAGGNHFITRFSLSDKSAGVYKIKMKAMNTHGWSETSDEYDVPKEHEGDQTEQGSLAVESSSAELRISFVLLVSLIVAHFYC